MPQRRGDDDTASARSVRNRKPPSRWDRGKLRGCLSLPCTRRDFVLRQCSAALFADPLSAVNLGGSSRRMGSLKRGEVDLPVPEIELTLDGQEVTGFECRDVLGKGTYGQVQEAVCQTSGPCSPHISVACKTVGPSSKLLALHKPFRVGCVLAVRCCEDDVDSSVQSLLEANGLLEAEGDDILLYWLCKVLKRARRPGDPITVQWLEHDGVSADSLTMSCIGTIVEIWRDSLVSVVRGNEEALQPDDNGIQFGAGDHAGVCSDIARVEQLSSSFQDAAREFKLATELRNSLCPCLMSCRGGAVSEGTQTVLILMSKMETDLTTLIKSKPRGMPERACQLYAASIVCALEELHRSRTVHLDVKPQNCLLSDGGDVLRLGDFGTATIVDNCDDMELQVSLPFCT